MIYYLFITLSLQALNLKSSTSQQFNIVYLQSILKILGGQKALFCPAFLLKLKKIFMENFIDVKEDINRLGLSWRNQGSYL